VSEPRSLAGLEDAMRALLSWSETSRVPMVIIGGVAVSMLSKPRTTKDVDAVVWLPDHEAWPAFLLSGKPHGIVPRIPKALDFALGSRVLLLHHEASGVPIDLSMGALAFEENAVRRAVLTAVGDLRVPLPVPEDLLVMKAVAHRARDIADIESILRVHPVVDEAWLLSTVREFAEALDSPEILTDLVRLLGEREAVKPKKKPRARRR
jgi:hypothetical protein